MIRNFNNLKQAAGYFHSLGMNVILASKDISYYNIEDNNIFKAPSHSFSHWQSNKQSKDELSSLDFKSSVGVGIILGWKNIYAIDIDGCIDPNVLQLICQKLNLPDDYKWIIRSGSRAGYHLIFRCKNNNRTNEDSKNENHNSDIEDIGKRMLGSDPTNAYYPFPSKRYFSKIEFIWEGNIMLPPSLHQSGNLYSFLNGIPGSLPINVDFEHLLKVQKILGSAKSTDSKDLVYDPDDLERGNYMIGHRFWDYANTDVDRFPLSPAHRNKNNIIISFSEKMVVDNLIENNPKVVTQINWAILNPDGEIIKRDQGSYLSSHLSFHDTHDGEIDYNIALKIVKPKKDVLRGLLFDITFTNDIYLALESYKEVLFNIVSGINLGLDMFTEPGTKYQDRNGDNFKRFYFFDGNDYPEEIKLQFSQIKEAHTIKWKSANKWGDFGSLYSIYDLYCYYHYEQFVLGWLDGHTYDGNVEMPPGFMTCNLDEFKEKSVRKKSQDNEYTDQEFDEEYETDWSHYNDNLDMDQQSDEFWNQF